MKIIKLLLKLVMFLVALVVLALLTVPLWFGPVVKSVANSVVPGIVKSDFHLSYLTLNPYTARFELGGMQLSNPSGYSEKYAAKVGEIVFDGEMMTLLTDVIHIEEIKIRDVFVSYVSGGSDSVSNFEQIQYNVAGGKDKYEAAKAAKTIAEGAAKTSSAEAPAEKPSKKFIIDRLEISGLSINLGGLPLRLPCDLVLKDIGRDTNGATIEEISEKVWAEIQKTMGQVGEMMKVLGGTTGDAASKTVESVLKLGKATGNIGKTTGEVGVSAVEDVGKSVKALGKVLKADKGTKKAGDSAKKALDSIKGLLGD